MQAAIAYIRVSTAKQGRSGLGLEAKFAEVEGFRYLQIFTETESGCDDDRPELGAALELALGPELRRASMHRCSSGMPSEVIPK
jgi:Resolvase, N terminal domain